MSCCKCFCLLSLVDSAVFADLGRLVLKASILFVRDNNDGQVSLN